MAFVRAIALVVLLYTFTVDADDPRVNIIATDPPLDPVSNSIIQEKDRDVQLTCVVENKPEKSDVQWMVESFDKNTSVTQISTATRSYDAFRWAIDKPSPTAWRLRVQNAQVTNEGKYICQVQVVSQNYITDSRELRIVQEPQISDLLTSSDMTKDEDESDKLECFATGRPKPLIKWTRMAGELLPNGGTEFQGNVLRIDRFKADHAGIYKCTASNSAGEEERTIRITVNFRPELRTSTPIIKQARGYQQQLVCNIKGYPPPTAEQIAWTKEGRPVVSTSRIRVRNIPGASNRITSIVDIFRVESEDFGRYRCSATNDYGSQYITMEFQESQTPTGLKLRSGAGPITLSATAIAATFIMLLSVCLLQL